MNAFFERDNLLCIISTNSFKLNISKEELGYLIFNSLGSGYVFHNGGVINQENDFTKDDDYEVHLHAGIGHKFIECDKSKMPISTLLVFTNDGLKSDIWKIVKEYLSYEKYVFVVSEYEYDSDDIGTRIENDDLDKVMNIYSSFEEFDLNDKLFFMCFAAKIDESYNNLREYYKDLNNPY